MKSDKSAIQMGTKAETLYNLSKLGYKIPKIYFFKVKEWHDSNSTILKNIINNLLHRLELTN